MGELDPKPCANLDKTANLENLEYVKKLIEEAMRRVLNNDTSLISNGVHERSVSHMLAVYIRENLRKRGFSIHVDCEYNRLDTGNKKILSKRVYPDIIVHKRQEPCNYIVIEMKKTSNRTTEHDKEKLIEFTKNNGEYKYKFGVLIEYDPEYQAWMTWFKSGEIKEMRYQLSRQ